MRATVGYRTRTNWALSTSFTYLDTSGQALAQSPPNGILFSTRTHPEANEDADSAVANGSFDYKVFDIVAGRPVFENRFSHVEIFGGVRFADIAQTLRADYDGRDFVNGVVSSAMDMEPPFTLVYEAAMPEWIPHEDIISSDGMHDNRRGDCHPTGLKRP